MNLRSIIIPIILFLSAGSSFAVEMLPGTVFVTRNRDEEQNTSPGHYNHLAIYVGHDSIVECQAGLVEHGKGQGVICTRVKDFLARDYTPIIILQPRRAANGRLAAETAISLVGLPSRDFSSLIPILSMRQQDKGLNCVSVIEVSFAQVDRDIWKLFKPDDIFKFQHLFHPARTLRR